MNLLRFNFKPSVSPPDRYRYTCPDGFIVVADEKYLWLRKIKQHYEDNNIPLPDGWEALAEDQLCRVLPSGYCVYSDGSKPAVFLDRMTTDDWKRGMTVLEQVATAPDPLVDQATAESRARICAACPANIVLKGCSACAGIADWIVRIRGSVKTEPDKKLAQCGVCHCSNRAQVWVKAELLAKGVNAEQRALFETLPWCWKTQALRELETQA
jgi:hypothetical protein